MVATLLASMASPLLDEPVGLALPLLVNPTSASATARANMK
jgi:hypothetical protein